MSRIGSFDPNFISSQSLTKFHLLPEFSSNQFETFHRCYKHIEDMHVTFCRRENIFDKITALDLDNFEVRFQLGVARSCNQLHSEFTSIQF